MTAIFDMDAALVYCDNDAEILREILISFRNIWPQVLEELQAALTANDALQVEKRAHFLKGRARTIVAGEVAEIAYRLEAMGEKKQLADGQAAWQELSVALKRLDDYLAQNGLA